MQPMTVPGVETTAIRLVVEQHHKYRRDTPEAFDWEQVINPKVAAIALNIVQEIKDRRAEWPLLRSRSGQESDPAIPGLQEALRVIARTAVWNVQSEQKARLREGRWEGARHAGSVSVGPGDGVRAVSLPALW